MATYSRMKVTFLLPARGLVPTGGYKVVLEYANKMVADNIDVTLIYPFDLRRNKILAESWFGKLRLCKKALTKTLRKQYSVNVWFKLDSRVREKVVPYLHHRFIPDADVVFATAWETAEWVNTFPERKGKKFYLIQHYEDWYGTDKEAVDATWKMPLNKVVIATWLQEYAESLGEPSVLIRNGLNFKDYYIEKPITDRSRYHVSMLYHDLEIKGSVYGIRALEQVKKEIPGLEVTLFSTFQKPDWIPEWMTYHYVPKNLREIYNNSSIFISASIEEGWGLPRAEAMQCGCAVVLTATGGHLDYGTQGVDCIFTPVKDVDAMSHAITDLIRNDDKRIAMAEAGNRTVQQFTWESAYERLKQYMQQA